MALLMGRDIKSDVSMCVSGPFRSLVGVLLVLLIVAADTVVKNVVASAI